VEGTEPSQDPEPVPPGWLIVTQSVPPTWQTRARTVALIPLLPEELQSLIDGRRAHPAIDPEELPMVTAIARGLSARQIAKELGTTPRTVYRHVARLRASFKVETLAQLAAELARRGF